MVTLSFLQQEKEIYMNKIINFTPAQSEYRGIGFINSHKSENKIMIIADEMISKTKSEKLKLLEIIVDRSNRIDLDRTKIRRLQIWMKKDYINAIVVRNIFELSTDINNLLQFMKQAEQLNVAIYSMDTGLNPAYIPYYKR